MAAPGHPATRGQYLQRPCWCHSTGRSCPSWRAKSGPACENAQVKDCGL